MINADGTATELMTATFRSTALGPFFQSIINKIRHLFPTLPNFVATRPHYALVEVCGDPGPSS